MKKLKENLLPVKPPSVTHLFIHVYLFIYECKIFQVNNIFSNFRGSLYKNINEEEVYVYG